jgi:hypothetical protein
MNPHTRLTVNLRPTPSFNIYSSTFEGGGPGPFLAQFKNKQTYQRAFELLEADGYRAADVTLATKAWRGLKGQDQFRTLQVIARERPSRPELLVSFWSNEQDGVTLEKMEKMIIPPGALVVVEKIIRAV